MKLLERKGYRKRTGKNKHYF